MNKKEKVKEMWQPSFKKFLFWDVPDGWKDLGLVAGFGDRSVWTIKIHSFCKNRIKVGKVNGLVFYWCPVCKVQVKDGENNYLYI